MKRTKRWILILVFLSVVSTVGIVAAGYFFFYEEVKPKSVLFVELSENVPEVSPSGIQEFLRPEARSVRQLVYALERAGKEPNVSACLVNMANLSVGWGKAEEIHEALLDFQSSGKPVIAYLETAGLSEYYLASAASRVFMPPEGFAQLSLLSEAPFVRTSLEKLKIKPNFLREGKYKSGPEMFTREQMSEPYRESLNSLLDSLTDSIREKVTAQRRVDDASLQLAFDQSFLSSKRALELGVIDDLAYPDGVLDVLKEQLDVPKINKVSICHFNGSGGLLESFSRKPEIALVYLVGSIVSGESQRSGPLGSMVGSDTVWKQLEEIRKDRSIRAVVLRVNSPGGSGLASDIIWRAVCRVREEKPVIVSMSNVAASGGYYIAMGADHILADPCTITGSIGVFAGKFNLHGFYDRIGMNWEQLKRGENADIFSDYSDFSPEQREIVQGFLEDFYTTFVSKAAEGRKKSYEELHAVAQGRVWTGSQALESGLVDELGGLRRAIDVAKETAGIALEEQVRLVIFPKRKGILEQIREKQGKFGVHLPESVKKILLHEAICDILSKERILAIAPDWMVVE